MTLGEKVQEVEKQRTLSEAMQGNQNASREQNSRSHDYGCFEKPAAQERGSRYLTARLKRDAPASSLRSNGPPRAVPPAQARARQGRGGFLPDAAKRLRIAEQLPHMR